MKIAAAVEYCGASFSGWQQQKHATSIQQYVEEALSKVADHSVEAQCAGRTDAGVHALYQVIHFETTAQRENHAWVFGGNSHMPSDICLLWTKQVPDEFNARFSATKRTYRYIIFNRATRPAVHDGLVTWEYRPLNADMMAEAASGLTGEHDFTSFRAAGCQSKSPIREIHRLDIFRQGDYIVIDVEANAFLQHMVRNIAGVLMAIGAGDAEPGWVTEVLDARDRTAGGITASADGLYLISIEYPGRYKLPKPPINQWPLLL